MVDELTLLDGTHVVSLPAAARRVGVAERTIRTWEQEGKIARIASLNRTRYYRLHDIQAAESATRSADPARKRARRMAQRLADAHPVSHIDA